MVGEEEEGEKESNDSAGLHQQSRIRSAMDVNGMGLKMSVCGKGTSFRNVLEQRCLPPPRMTVLTSPTIRMRRHGRTSLSVLPIPPPSLCLSPLTSLGAAGCVDEERNLCPTLPCCSACRPLCPLLHPPPSAVLAAHPSSPWESQATQAN